MRAFKLDLIGIMTGLQDNPHLVLLGQHKEPNWW